MRKCPTRTVMALWLAVLVATALVSAVGEASAQTPYVPYYGKNLVRYDRFDWQIYKTEHFEIYYYPEIEKHLERVAGYAESAYQQISADLKHDLAFKVPLIIFKTHSEFEQQNVIPGAAEEGVGAFAEPYRDRMLLPLDSPPDLLYRLIVHELTHIFEFDIIPQSLVRDTTPLWVAEGLSDYMTGIWRPIDLMTVRDAAIADIIPKMSQMEGYGNTSNPRLVYNLGHATFEFIESKWGKEGLRQFLFSMRKSIVGGGEGAYQEAFQLTAEEFDQQFDRYLKARFKPFRDKETPADYGRNLAPKPEKSSFYGALTAEPSPSGDLLAVATINRKDREVDIVLISAKDGKVIRNLTSGLRPGHGLRLHRDARRTVDLGAVDQLVAERRSHRLRRPQGEGQGDRHPERGVAEGREADRPEVRGRARVAVLLARRPVAGLLGDAGRGRPTSSRSTSTPEAVTNLTKDDIANYGPTYSPDGKFIVYLGADQREREAVQAGPVDDEEDPADLRHARRGRREVLRRRHADLPVDGDGPEQGDRSGGRAQREHLQPVDAQPEERRAEAVDRRARRQLLAGRAARRPERRGSRSSPTTRATTSCTRSTGRRRSSTANTSDFGAPGPIIDFQAPLSHTLIAENRVKKGGWDKMFLDGRPPLNVGVTSGGNFFGGTQVSFADVLGDRRIDIYAASMSQYRQFGVSMINLAKRFNWALQGYWQDEFYYGYGTRYYDPAYSPYIDRDLADVHADQPRGDGVRHLPAGPVPPRRGVGRLRVHAGAVQRPGRWSSWPTSTSRRVYGNTLFRNGWYRAAERRRSSRRRRSSGSSARSPARPCAPTTRSRRASATTCCSGRRSTSRCAST